VSVLVVVLREIGMVRNCAIVRRAEDYFVFVMMRDMLVIRRARGGYT
jgi:hypothetical protein